MKIAKVMNRVVVIDRDIRLSEAAKIMSKRGIGSLLVFKDKKISGIITERDVLKNVKNLGSKISKVMSKNVICVDENDSLEDAALLMSKHKIKRLPVLKNKKVTGIITATDILAHSNDLNEEFFFE